MLKFSNNEQRTYETISGTGEGAVMIVPVLGNDLVLISEYAAAVDDYSITFPKGKIDKGETIGYGSTYKAKKRMLVGTIPIGYGDGFNRLFSNRVELYYKNKKVRIVGRVSMDLITIDLTKFK